MALSTAAVVAVGGGSGGSDAVAAVVAVVVIVAALVAADFVAYPPYTCEKIRSSCESSPPNMGGFASTDSIIEAAAEWNMSIMLRGDSEKLLEPTHDCTGCLGSLRKVRMLPSIANWQLALKVARLAQFFSGQHP